MCVSCECVFPADQSIPATANEGSCASDFWSRKCPGGEAPTRCVERGMRERRGGCELYSVYTRQCHHQLPSSKGECVSVESERNGVQPVSVNGRGS